MGRKHELLPEIQLHISLASHVTKKIFFFTTADFKNCVRAASLIQINLHEPVLPKFDDPFIFNGLMFSRNTTANVFVRHIVF